MSKIIIHGWVQDNVGTYHKPGSKLTVDADGGAGCIGAHAAHALAKGKAATPLQPAKPGGDVNPPRA